MQLKRIGKQVGKIFAVHSVNKKRDKNMEKDKNLKEGIHNETEKEATQKVADEQAKSQKDTCKESKNVEETVKQNILNTDKKADETKESAKDDKKAEPKDVLAEAQKEIEKYKDLYLRSVAEFDNYRKRTLKEKTQLLLNGSEKAVSAMLPIIDDMERAIESATKTDDIEVIKEGMKLIFQKTNKVMESLGVKKIDTKDADFDTDFHEAVAMVPGMGDDKKGKVLDCVQAGYTLNDKVIRHAKVAVGQ